MIYLKEDSKVNTFGKSHEELVEEQTQMLEEGFAKHDQDTQNDQLIRDSLMILADELKDIAENHNVLPANIVRPFKDDDDNVLLRIHVLIEPV